MTITVEQVDDIQGKIDACLASIERHGKNEGPALIAIKLPRKPRGDAMRVIGGLTGKVVQWGDGVQNPSVVLVDAARLIAKLTELLETASETV